MPDKNPNKIIKRLVKGTPFGKTGYSDQARTVFDFADYDAIADDPDIMDVPSDLSAAAKIYEAQAPVNKAKWKPSKFRSIGNPNGAAFGQWYKFEDGDYSGEAKIYDEPSEYGIDNGRVSKFYLTHKEKPIANYDRGWDIKISPEHKDYYNKILAYLNSYKK